MDWKVSPDTLKNEEREKHEKVILLLVIMALRIFR